MTNAGKLLAKHSVGTVDSYDYGTTNDVVDLYAGFPQNLRDSAVTKIANELAFKTREASKRNIQVLMGGAVVDYPTAGTDAYATLDTTAPVILGEEDLVLVTPTGTFAANQTVVIYHDTSPEKVTVATVKAYDAGTKALTLDTGFGLNYAVSAGEVVRVYKADPYSLGGIDTVNYFSASLLWRERDTSRVAQVDFWKCMSGTGAKFSANATDFGSNDWTLKVLQPTAADIAGSLAHVATEIAKYPLARTVQSPDVR